MFKKLVRITTAALLGVSLLLLAVAIGLSQSFSASKTKQWIKQSGLYKSSELADSFINNISMTFGSEMGAGSNTGPATVFVKQAARDALSPSFLQSSGDQIVDGTFRWLDGKASQPDFKIDTKAAQDTFNQSFARQIKQRYDSLPVCTRAQLLNPSMLASDPTNIACKIPGVEITGKLQESIAAMQSNPLVPGNVLTFQTMSGQGSDAQAAPQNNLKDSKLPRLYRLIKITPWLVAALTVVFLLVLLWSAGGLASSAQIIGRVLVFDSLLLAVGVGLQKVFLSSLSAFLPKPGGSGSSLDASSAPAINIQAVFDKYTAKVADALLGSFVRYLLIMAAIYLVLGVILMIIGRRPTTEQLVPGAPLPTAAPLDT